MITDLIQKRITIEEMQVKFYCEILPTKIGKILSLKRGYGHAKYKILGDHEMWHETQNSSKIYFRVENGKLEFTGNRVYDNTLCIIVERLGGYDGNVPEEEKIENIFRELKELKI